MSDRLHIKALLLAASIAVAGSVLTGCNKAADNKGEAQATAAEKSDAGKTGADQKGEGEKAGEKKEESAVTLKPEEIRAAGIQVATVSSQPVSGQINVTATIQANQDQIAHVAPRVAGRIIHVSANLGDFIKQGQTMAVLDSIELGEARSSYRTAQSDLSLAKANFDRLDKLYRQEIVAQKDWLAARADYQKALAASQAAADKLRMLGVAPGAGRSTFPLTAPFGGMVIEKDAVIGELAEPNKSLFTVANLATVWIESDLFEKDLGKVRIGAPAKVTVAAYPNDTFEGKLTYISTTVDPQTKTVKGRVEVQNPRLLLKPGMFANVTINIAENAQAILVPADAVVIIKGTQSVFVSEKGHFEPRAVTTGERVKDKVVIKDGLKPGDQVVVMGAYQLKARLLKYEIGEE